MTLQSLKETKGRVESIHSPLIENRYIKHALAIEYYFLRLSWGTRISTTAVDELSVSSVAVIVTV